ncbi:hypothetical protein [Nostoc favosum]|uniref:Secreted protein n=1 Tax=Nostoc favosum CHAB5714 TaxID=2780399 RepID=A0ABS8I9V8_9NOSO|nr:hypothetical protein [Nostoc favosum]MCC5600885.1 hypothetical protein [Nostoc favosum CHAB5714]
MPTAASYAPTVSLPLIMGAIACDGLRLPGVSSLVKVEITAPCSKVLAIWHHLSLNCRLNEISTEQNSHKSPKLTQRCRTQQPTHSARSSQLLETLRERYNWLVMY